MKPLRHNGGNCPVHPDTEVRVRFRDATDPWSKELPAGKFVRWDWGREHMPHDIVAYFSTGDSQHD